MEQRNTFSTKTEETKNVRVQKERSGPVFINTSNLTGKTWSSALLRLSARH